MLVYLLIIGEIKMPIDQETLEFLVNETVENALQDSKEKLSELASKYKLIIKIKAPKLIEVQQEKEGNLIWLED